ncbi:hypothetical protein OWC48_45795 [Bradyrhizobium sp. Arg816]|nr:hypothetical protein [Bradyrhizobium sp. Arg816]MDI3567642.1 hypothetical protein [Bradyrhizobium sp. Arg816]
MAGHDPDNTIQHIYATNLNVGPAPKNTLRVLDALQPTSYARSRRRNPEGRLTRPC